MNTQAREYRICSFKHDGKIHRIWQKTTLVKQCDEYLALVNNSTLIQESDGRIWESRDPAVTFFFKDQWFNVICMLRPGGVYYYCNIASPYVEKDNTIFYIDYDLDISLSPSNHVKILDEVEYYEHANQMKYSPKIDIIAKATLLEIKERLMKHEFPFDDQSVMECYQLFKEY